MSIIIAILIFGLLVFFHELGHFLFARRAGILVEEFAIGMGPQLLKAKKGETIYSIRAIPFGGFCKMLGEDEAVEAGGRSFSEKSVWQRFTVIFGGPLFNFIMAFAFAVLFMALVGGTLTTEIAQVDETLPAYEAGFQVGDVIVGFNNRHVFTADEFKLYLNNERPDRLDVTVRRNGEKVVLNLAPARMEDGSLRIGIAFGVLDFSNPLQVIKQAALEVLFWIRIVFYSLGMMLSGGVSKDDVAGPVGLIGAISSGYTESVQYGFKSVIATLSKYIVLLSANLGVMNLLPIPALDGGRLVFILIEAIRRKPVNPDSEGKIHFIGYVLLMGLMVFILFNDLSKIFSNLMEKLGM